MSGCANPWAIPLRPPPVLSDLCIGGGDKEQEVGGRKSVGQSVGGSVGRWVGSLESPMGASEVCSRHEAYLKRLRQRHRPPAMGKGSQLGSPSHTTH